MFKKKPKKAVDETTKPPPKPIDVPQQKKVSRPKLTKQQKKKHLADYLNKAGYYEASVDVLRKRVFYLSLILTGMMWVALFTMLIINSKPVANMVVFTLGVWTALLAFVWLFLWGIIYFFLEMRIYRRTKELEEVLPDFLQLTSANISAGMPIDRALWLAIRPNFGVLAKEIEDVAKATLSGQDLSDALTDFVHRYDSVLLKRSISILLEGLSAGGELADLLNKIALNIQELKIMKKEMAANVTTYAIFISFASVGIAPILFALATQLISIVLGLTSSLDLSSAAGGMFAISTTVDPLIERNFKIYCYIMLAITAGMSAAIIAVIRKGNVKEAVKNVPIFILISLAIYFLASQFFATLMGGFV